MPKFDQIVTQIKKYNQARGWDSVAEDYAKSIMIEAAELLEIFQWDVSDNKPHDNLSYKDHKEISFEAADIFIYLIDFCDKANINLLEAVEEKLKYLEKKYPVEMFQGKHNEEEYIKRKKEYRLNKVKS
ncbi:MAG: MazG-like family protein [Patescibacteria group bacterium]|jgi:NTP pyrophosphatase (non-canonical NTP hydrolase)